MKVSLIQMDSRDNKEANFKRTVSLLDEAIKDSPDIICLSERFLYWGNDKYEDMEQIDSKRIKYFQKFAKEKKVNIILGSVALKESDKEKITNTAFVIDREGKIIYRYDKIFMYTVEREDLVIRERDTTRSGKELGLFELEGIKIGIGICFDLRYPEYFKALAIAGAEIIFLPASFRKTTGALAWEYLTKARAIENQVYFCACNQTGMEDLDARCGKTRIISFNGEIIKELNEEEGIITADLDLKKQEVYRKEFPVLKQQNFDLTLK